MKVELVRFTLNEAIVPNGSFHDNIMIMWHKWLASDDFGQWAKMSLPLHLVSIEVTKWVDECIFSYTSTATFVIELEGPQLVEYYMRKPAPL